MELTCTSAIPLFSTTYLKKTLTNPFLSIFFFEYVLKDVESGPLVFHDKKVVDHGTGTPNCVLLITIHLALHPLRMLYLCRMHFFLSFMPHTWLDHSHAAFARSLGLIIATRPSLDQFARSFDR